MKVRLVCATRSTQEEFFQKAALGQSFKLFKPPTKDLEILLFPDNTRGLPDVYNQAIEHAAADPAVLVFVHDDVHITDFYWFKHLFEALRLFDIVGVAGNVRRVPKQPSWYFSSFEWNGEVFTDYKREDFQYLSGIVGHGKGFPMDNLTVYGEACQECKLLDGLFIAAKSETLLAHDLRFDPQFAFHFYDMDFCRQAELKGLKMGTSRISVIHESVGNFNKKWVSMYNTYLAKYGD